MVAPTLIDLLKKQREIDQKKSNAKLSVDIERFEQRWLAEEVGVEVINSYNDAAQARFIAEMASFQLASGNFEP